jgi:hypothetical protein
MYYNWKMFVVSSWRYGVASLLNLLNVRQKDFLLPQAASTPRRIDCATCSLAKLIFRQNAAAE